MPQLLIVDGDQGSLRALCAQLDAGPYQVGGCAPEQVDASLAAGKPDAILVALGANPGLPMAVIRELKSSKREFIPLIAMGTRGDEVTRRTALRGGADDFLACR